MDSDNRELGVLKVMWCLTGSQCRTLRAVVMLDWWSKPSKSWVVAFCADWSGISVDVGRPARMALQ